MNATLFCYLHQYFSLVFAFHRLCCVHTHVSRILQDSEAIQIMIALLKRQLTLRPCRNTLHPSPAGLCYKTNQQGDPPNDGPTVRWRREFRAHPGHTGVSGTSPAAKQAFWVQPCTRLPTMGVCRLCIPEEPHMPGFKHFCKEDRRELFLKRRNPPPILFRGKLRNKSNE